MGNPSTGYEGDAKVSQLSDTVYRKRGETWGE
jgi:hypothetical protein